MEHHYHDLITLFNQEFEQKYRTKLIKGGDEPLYLPAGDLTGSHQLIFTRDYYASALHEISHWCVAGEKRRQLEDYGYWYSPDGRTVEQQEAFEKAEVKNQAIEWLFCASAQFSFQVSCDNLEGDFQPDRKTFQEAVQQQVFDYMQKPAILPKRALQFIYCLQRFYQTAPLTQVDFSFKQF